MKTLFTALMVVAGATLAQAAQTTATPLVDTSHIEMHEKMAKAHQQAADCLKAGKAIEECRQEFQTTCKDSGEPGQCGMGKGMKDKKGHHGHGK